MTRDQGKSTRYIQELDQTRCEGNWDAIPELVRKVRKHAPDRICLAVTAEAEYAITKSTSARPGTGRPTTARPSTTANISTEPQSFIPVLTDAIAKERTNTHDVFQARACLASLYLHVGDSQQALSTLPQDIEQEYSQLEGANTAGSRWTRVCAIKSVYIQGRTHSKTGANSQALALFESALPILALNTVQDGKEARLWTELYFTEFCMSSTRALKAQNSIILETEALSAFRGWATLWDGSGASTIGGRVSGAEVSRRNIWREYYTLLSIILEKGMPFPTNSLITAYPDASTNSQQIAELKKVESRYEAIILSEIQFPKAEESSEEVESFVDIIIRNWRIMCGAQWDESYLGDGGAEGISRGVLDILYRAATKTFHSTSLLRHLFTVHLAVADFDLAFKAFNTYMEIVKKGKARVEKTGIPEKGLDTDENVLRTASEYIKALCRYGRREESKKAKEIAVYFEAWLEKHHPSQLGEPEESRREEEPALQSSSIEPRVFALAWRSIGIAYAQWARLTFDGSARSEAQIKAILCFRKALKDEFQSTKDVETLFALGTILAERRELGPAIDVVKSGLLPRESATDMTGLGSYAGRFARERALIPLWHLLALLLSARQEFLTAARSCEAAFEQFQDPKILFGAEELTGTFRSEHLNEKNLAKNVGVVDDMDDLEKENILEVKITQLALIEVLEGPEVAVNASDELLSLYSRLFGEPHEQLVNQINREAADGRARTSSGTVRSAKGSIFGRKSRSLRNSHMGSVVEEQPNLASRPHTSQTVAPKIQVTNENGSTSKEPRHLKDHHHHHEKLHKQNSVNRQRNGGSLRKRDASLTRGSSPGRSPVIVDGEKFFTPSIGDQESWQKIDVRASQVGLAVSGENPIDNATRQSADSNMRHPHPPETQQLNQSEPALQYSDKQDTRLPASVSAGPAARFPKNQRRRRRTSILVKVWLLISGFYRRASLLDDAKGAIEEATKLVQWMESDVASEPNTQISVEDSGMGGGKTVAELWGDVFSERGHLATARLNYYHALDLFEAALTSDADHPSATVGLSSILLDIYSEDILPHPSSSQLIFPGPNLTFSTSTANTGFSNQNSPNGSPSNLKRKGEGVHHGPLGLSLQSSHDSPSAFQHQDPPPQLNQASNPAQPETNSAISKKTQRLDRLAARDRAYGLLSNLTKLGSGWNYSEAWFALARAYELGGQDAKAREVLWWCVELEEGRGVRGLIESFGGGSGGGYVL